MKKKITRWYEKNEHLKAFMNLMEDLPMDSQCEIAIDIIIEASELIDRDYSKIIQEIADFNPKNFKRWYDKNPNIHTAIESLRDLNDEQQGALVQKYSNKIINCHYVKLEEAK